jgi:hypothetical protein
MGVLAEVGAGAALHREFRDAGTTPFARYLNAYAVHVEDALRARRWDGMPAPDRTVYRDFARAFASDDGDSDGDDSSSATSEDDAPHRPPATTS